MRELWAIRCSKSYTKPLPHGATDRRASNSTYFSEEQAEKQIQQWIERCHRGGRPDLPLDYLEALEAYRL